MLKITNERLKDTLLKVRTTGGKVIGVMVPARTTIVGDNLVEIVSNVPRLVFVEVLNPKTKEAMVPPVVEEISAQEPVKVEVVAEIKWKEPEKVIDEEPEESLVEVLSVEEPKKSAPKSSKPSSKKVKKSKKS